MGTAQCRLRFKRRLVQVNSSKGKANQNSVKQIPEEQLRAAIESTGYRVLSVSDEAYEKKGSLAFGNRNRSE